ncbi:MAG: hypothetical protein LAO31_02740 [Acidobacteriia bacterium]|nr:hypothetical protein [Terriglobia bacterium]
MWLTVVVAVVCLGVGFAGGFWFYRSTMESERERGNLAKKISALPYILLDFMNNSRFNALTPDDKLEFITDFFRQELKALSVAAYTTTQAALDDFYQRKKLNLKPAKPSAKEQAVS